MSHPRPSSINNNNAAAAAAAASGGPPPPPLSALLTDALLEFLEAAVHTVLHARGLYPREAFERRRLYGSCLCPRARHPGVCAYVASALAALRGPLLRGALQEVAVVVREEQGAGGDGRGGSVQGGGRSLEKVSFVLHRSAAPPPPANAGAAASSAPPPPPAEVPLPDAAALEAAFAAALVKLQHLPHAPPLLQQAGGGGGAAGVPSAPPLTFEVLGLAASREGVDRSALMEEELLEEEGGGGARALLLPCPSSGAGVAGWPIKTIRLHEGGLLGGNGRAAAAAATLTILVEARAQS